MVNTLPQDAWPEAPWDASYHHDEGWWGWQGHGWTVPHEPPGGFPFIDPPFDRARYGPPGTAWIFTEADMLAGLAGLPTTVGRWGVNAALRKLGVTLGQGSEMGWRTPDYTTPPTEGKPMRWIHVTIIGKLGQYEQLAHTFNFRTHPVADVDQDAAALQTFAEQVRDHWTNFWNAPHAPGLSALKNSFWNQLVYQEVRAAYLEQTDPATFTTHQGKRGPVKDFHYPRPRYLVETQYAMFGGTGLAGGAGGRPLPLEVACALTLETGQRGARNRGRVYLGGLDSGWMGDNGQFEPGITRDTAARFGDTFLNPLNASTGNRMHVVSRTYATSLGINGVSVGLTPDSQRRRRRSVPETATRQWSPA